MQSVRKVDVYCQGQIDPRPGDQLWEWKGEVTVAEFQATNCFDSTTVMCTASLLFFFFYYINLLNHKAIKPQQMGLPSILTLRHDERQISEWTTRDHRTVVNSNPELTPKNSQTEWLKWSLYTWSNGSGSKWGHQGNRWEEMRSNSGRFHSIHEWLIVSRQNKLLCAWRIIG